MRGRPPKDIDPEQVMRLAALGVPMVDIAFVVGCSVDTLERRFRDEIEEGRANGRTRLRQKQLEVALSGNPAMLIWLGKQMLGQADKQEVAQTGAMQVRLNWGQAVHKIEAEDITPRLASADA